MVEAIEQLHDAEVEPDVLKIEGLDRCEDCQKIVAAARRGGRTRVGCIILGRGEDDRKVSDWLTTAAGVPGFVGFAVGRTDFWDPLIAWRARKTTREEAVTAIARRYRHFVDIFERARPLTNVVCRKGGHSAARNDRTWPHGRQHGRRLLAGGHQCVVFDRSPKAVEDVTRAKAVGASSIVDLVKQLETPRAIWLMVPAAAVDPTVSSLLPHLTPGDILVDGGNSYYVDDIRRAQELAQKGIHYVDVGTSGGVWGRERGYC